MIDSAVIILLVRGMFPELTVDVVPDSFFLAWMDWSRDQNGTNFGSSQARGIALLLAHAWYRYALSQGSGVNGVVTSVSTGQISASFAQQQGGTSDSDYMSTFAGMSWIKLRNSKAKIMIPRPYF